MPPELAQARLALSLNFRRLALVFSDFYRIFIAVARPINIEEPIRVTITDVPKLGLYLDDLIAEGGHGHSRGEVARTLVWRGIEEYMKAGLLDRRRATAQERRRVDQRLLSSHGTRRRRKP